TGEILMCDEDHADPRNYCHEQNHDCPFDPAAVSRLWRLRCHQPDSPKGNRTLGQPEGLFFAFNNLEDIVAIRSNSDKHSRAARAIAEEYFRAEKILAKLLANLGL